MVKAMRVFYGSDADQRTMAEARVTTASVRRLGLAEGSNVYAAFKAERLRGGAG